MPAPLIAAGVAVASRLAAKKAAQEAAKKVAKKTVTKAATKAAKANARGLKAAQGKSLASPIKKATAKVNSQERAMVKRLAEANKGLNMKEPYATKNAMQLADSVYANNFCTEVMMYMTWGRKNGDPQWAPISTFDGMNDRLRSAYLRMADSVQGSVSPVGSAWKYVRENYPSIELYNADESHPSVAGTYLAACTFYASIFRKHPSVLRLLVR